MTESIMPMALLHLERRDARPWKTVHARELVEGVRWGGSDAQPPVT